MGRSSFPLLRERRMAHTDAERDAALARLRTAQHRFEMASSCCPTCGGWEAATKERTAAVVEAVDVGLAITAIARVYGLAQPNNISRMYTRYHGEDHSSEAKRRARAS